ncbi:MAG: Glutamate carboxypeptidase [Candidatus Angelobacter sp.]|jgi:N-acetylated-alpha-linked acidic dipeptidase|nr:Glutamate carboxypeptidase [Candidatus Angelobacter sp.]
MKKQARFVLLITLLGALASAQSKSNPKPQTPSAVNPDQRITGFTAANSAKQIEIETKFKAVPSPEQAQKWHRRLTAEPHPSGSERNNLLAREIADTWKTQGMEDVVIHEYDVLQSTPREVSLEMVSPKNYKAQLREEAYAVDPDTKNPRVKSAYSSMSPSGEVTAPIVYAFSGNPEDYEVLRKNGIDVRGKVVLVRYSNPYSYRGFKALTAQRLGAAAIIIYSDPQEDGYKRGKVFPDGPWGPESHIQRGAITYDFIVPGDPLTPGWASVPGAKKIPIAEAESMPKIMALPLSWHDAKPLLENMGGPVAPKKWQGGLPITYRLGGNATVHVKIDMDNSVKPNYVVEARVRGAELPDEWVVLGNHRDAWEFGGVDPSSGTASMLEVTRALGQLAKQGIRPRRTIVVCSWDGEEVGLTGSTEWGEQFGEDLKKKMVAYLNVDSSTSGPDFEVTAVASLSPMLVALSRSVDDPSGKSLYEAWKATALRKRREESKKAAIRDADLVDTQIGSGSDHTVFLNHLGRPTVGLTFDGPYGVYHSMYDDHFWMTHFGDPGFKYHTLMAQYWGALGLRLANADVLPFDFESYARSLRKFVIEVEAKKGAAAHLEFKPLLAAVDRFEIVGRQLNVAVDRALKGSDVVPGKLQNANAGIMQVESNWLNPDGIPGRPWFKHMLYAARYTYAHLELPGLTEAVENGDWTVAREQAKILQDAIEKNNLLLRQVRADLQKQK